MLCIISKPKLVFSVKGKFMVDCVPLLWIKYKNSLTVLLWDVPSGVIDIGSEWEFCRAEFEFQ